MRCVFHKEEFITNFCRSEKCLLPLCPVCVKLHSEQHARSGDCFGVFELIDVCVEEAYDELSGQCTKIQLCKEKLGSINELRKGYEAQLVEQVRIAKSRLFEQMQHQFARFEEELNFIMDQKENELMSIIYKLSDSLDPLCQDIEATLIRLRQPETCLESLIQYYYYRGERIQQWDHIILTANEKIKAACDLRAVEVCFNPEALSGLRGLLSDMLKLAPVSLPIPTYEIPLVTSSSKAKYISLERACSKPMMQPGLKPCYAR